MVKGYAQLVVGMAIAAAAGSFSEGLTLCIPQSPRGNSARPLMFLARFLKKHFAFTLPKMPDR